MVQYLDGIFFAAVFITNLFTGVSSLEIKVLSIPPHANLGDTVVLKCLFDLGRGVLYSVKWYKDDSEFFRFMPDNNPQTQIFPLPGINLDTSMSDMNQVTLTRVSYKSSGTYRCEVSTEAPAFATDVKEKNMTIYAYPERPPLITGISPSYFIGDYITGNCSSGASNPAPKLSWFINGKMADSFLTDRYPVVEHGGGLFSAAIGLRFLADRSHFQEPGYFISLTCSSIVGDMAPQSVKIEPVLASSSANQKVAQERLQNRGRCTLHPIILIVRHRRNFL